MKNSNLLFVSIFLFALLVIGANGQKKEKKETIKGIVVAQYSFPMCSYHPCVASLVVKTTDAEPTRFIRVGVIYFSDHNRSDQGFPVVLVERSQKWKFKAMRKEIYEGPLEKYLRTMDYETGRDITEEMAVPAWILLKGAEDEKLPFGKILPYYKADEFVRLDSADK
jgi:hypothetical protein